MVKGELTVEKLRAQSKILEDKIRAGLKEFHDQVGEYPRQVVVRFIEHYDHSVTRQTVPDLVLLTEVKVELPLL